MGSMPSVTDLRLVQALAGTGSIGAAARQLQVSQPSASQRLARLERRCRVRLFERSSTGSRPTEGGKEMVRQADHILEHLSAVYEVVLAAADRPVVVVGTFPSLASSLFPALELAIGADLVVEQRVDHRERLVAWVAEGSMHGAVVGVADRTALPRGTTSTLLGHDRLVLFVPVGVDAPGSGGQPYRGRAVAYATYDLGGPAVAERLTRLGAVVRRAGTVPTAVEMARVSRCLAVVPQSAVTSAVLHSGEAVRALPFASTLTLSLVTAQQPPAELVAALPTVARRLGLS
jgi:DNA-binding transcriptional LysR family regulator